MPPSARHQVLVLLSMRGTPARLAHGGPAEPRGVVEPREESSRNVEARTRTRVEEAVFRTRQPTPSGAAAAQKTPDVPMHQAASSSSAIVSSGGEHAKRLADPTVEVKFRCLQARDQEAMHNANVELPTAASAASRVGGAISIPTSHAAGGAASSPQVGGSSSHVGVASVNQFEIATHAGVQASSVSFLLFFHFPSGVAPILRPSHSRLLLERLSLDFKLWSALSFTRLTWVLISTAIVVPYISARAHRCTDGGQPTPCRPAFLRFHFLVAEVCF